MSYWDSLPNFTADEFKCRCCGIEEMSQTFMTKLQDLRTAAGFPFIITSAFRCEAHNANVSSTSGPTAPHVTGRAVDIHCSGKQARTLVIMHDAYGMTGLGVRQKGDHNSRFIHIDNLHDQETPGPRPWIWSY